MGCRHREVITVSGVKCLPQLLSIIKKEGSYFHCPDGKKNDNEDDEGNEALCQLPITLFISFFLNASIVRMKDQ